jgi:UTP--glucose-1-phosphate uridylyltransferase
MKTLVRKAVIPAAGYGTRFLPISKAVPKEMLPLVDRPVIQYVVEEAVASGIEDILIVISRSKRSIEEHFHPAHDLEAELAAKGRLEDLRSLQSLNRLARIHFIWQARMGGLGDAILHARDHVGQEPFAVLLGDTVVTTTDTARPLTRQLADVVETHGGSAVALQEVPEDKVSRYGILGGQEIAPGLIRASQFVEKPRPDQTPSRLAVSARYVLSPAIFDHLKNTPGAKAANSNSPTPWPPSCAKSPSMDFALMAAATTSATSSTSSKPTSTSDCSGMTSPPPCAPT